MGGLSFMSDKKKRGRPKKTVEIPVFNNNSELRDYLIQLGLEITVNLKTEALKKGNVRKPQITKAKLMEYKTTLESIKILNSLIKDKAIDDLENKFRLLEQSVFEIRTGNTSDSEIFELSDELKKEIEDFENGLKVANE